MKSKYLNELNQFFLLLLSYKTQTSLVYLKKVKEVIAKYNLENRIILYGESKNIKEIMQISKIFNNLKFEENVYLREILVIGDNVCIGIGALIYLGVKNEGQLDA